MAPLNPPNSNSLECMLELEYFGNLSRLIVFTVAKSFGTFLLDRCVKKQKKEKIKNTFSKDSRDEALTSVKAQTANL